MGLGGRIFLFDDENNLHRVSVKRFTKLYRYKNPESFPEFANQRMQCAFLMIEFENRKPIEIFHAQFTIVKFDEKGYLDADERSREERLSFAASLLHKSDISNPSVIDATQIFSKKRWHNEFRWKPSAEIIEILKKAVFVEKKSKLRLV